MAVLFQDLGGRDQLLIFIQRKLFQKTGTFRFDNVMSLFRLQVENIFFNQVAQGVNDKQLRLLDPWYIKSRNGQGKVDEFADFTAIAAQQTDRRHDEERQTNFQRQGFFF